MILFPDELKVTRSLQKVLRNRAYDVRVDTSFRAVMSACAQAPRDGQSGTWITGEMIDAYCALHGQGIAHCVETWIDGDLVGGLYGIALGRAFYGESMFARATDASKIAFVHLVRQLQALAVRRDRLPDAHRSSRPLRRARNSAQRVQRIAYEIGKL